MKLFTDFYNISDMLPWFNTLMLPFCSMNYVVSMLALETQDLKKLFNFLHVFLLTVRSFMLNY